MAIRKKFRYASTTCNLVYSEKSDRVAFSFGEVQGKRESLRTVKGSPKMGEIIVSVGNVSFFVPGDPSNESIQGLDFTGLSIRDNTLVLDKNSRFTAGHIVIKDGVYVNKWPAEYNYITGSNPRKLIGCTHNGTIFDLVCDGRKLLEKGLTFADYKGLIPVLENHLGDRIRLMVNCDGGGSAGIRWMGSVLGPYDGRTIGVFLEIYSQVNVCSLPVLRKGSYGSYVVYLQQQLNRYEYGLVCDGAFGNITQDAVRRFQSRYGLTVDGIVGRQTWGRLI